MSVRRLRLASLTIMVVAALILPTAALGDPKHSKGQSGDESHGRSAQASPSPSPSSASPSPSTRPTATPPASPSPTPSSGPKPPDHTPPAAGDIAVSMTGSAFLGQVGDVVEYTVVAEVGESTDDLIVTVSVPPEMDVASVPLDDEVEAMSANRSGNKEDIVWVVGSAGPGDPVELTWFGEVTQAGDLMATAVTEARAKQARATDATDTFLASAPQVSAEGSRPADKVLGKVIRRVPVTVAAPSGSILPVTGWSPAGMLWVAFSCVALGGLLFAFGLVNPSRRKAAAMVILVVLTAACTPPTEDVANPQEESQPEEAGEDDAEADEVDPPKERVLGKRIFNNEPEAVAEDTTAPEPAVITTYRRVITVVPAEDVPVQDDRVSDNTMAFTWVEPSREVPTATSGMIFDPAALSNLGVTFSSDQDGLRSSTTLTNASSEPLHVEGELLLEIGGAGGASSTLSSGPVDVILAPGGQVTVSYRYLLPSGEYTLTSSFQH